MKQELTVPRPQLPQKVISHSSTRETFIPLSEENVRRVQRRTQNHCTCPNLRDPFWYSRDFIRDSPLDRLDFRSMGFKGYAEGHIHLEAPSAKRTDCAGVEVVATMEEIHGLSRRYSMPHRGSGFTRRPGDQMMELG